MRILFNIFCFLHNKLELFKNSKSVSNILINQLLADYGGEGH